MGPARLDLNDCRGETGRGTGTSCGPSRFVAFASQTRSTITHGTPSFSSGVFFARMRFLRCLVAPSLLCAVLLSAGCETSQPKNTAAKVPEQATAPTVTQPRPQPAESQAATRTTAAAPLNPSDPVDALIARVEKLYNQGQAEYHDGHLDAARQNFDQAFNVMLSSNC